MFSATLRQIGKLFILIGILALVAAPLSVAYADPTVPLADLLIDGSTTVYPIVSVAQYQYTANTFELHSTGSGHGQISVLNGYVNIGMSSSSCSSSNAFTTTQGAFFAGTYSKTATPSLYGCPGQAGYDTQHQVIAHIVGQDAIAIITNNARACADKITRDQIQKIWQGGITDPNGNPSSIVKYTWVQAFPNCAGQPFANNTIVPIARIVGSGTRASFAALLGLTISGDTWPAEQAVISNTGLARKSGNPDMEKDIQQNPDHIAYVSLAYQAGVHPANLDCNSGGFTGCNDPGNVSAPTFSNVKDGSYPMRRNLYFYYLPNAAAKVTNFINFINNTDKGQAIVRNVGYVETLATNLMPPNWDVVIDHVGDIGDVQVLGGYWNKTGPADAQDPEFPKVRGWTRADVSFDAVVDILDVSTFGAFWNKAW